MARTLLASIVTVQLCAAVLLSQTPAPAASAGQGRAAAFVTAVTQAISRRDRAAVAEFMRYPATATVGGIGVPIRSRAELLTLYDSVFSPELRCLVDKSTFRVERGAVVFGEGRIRAEDVDGKFRITRISVPPAGGLAQPPPSKPKQVYLRRGKTQFAGRLYGDGVDGYIASLRKGDVVEARIEQFPGRSAALHIVEQKTGKSLDRPALKGSDGTAPAPRFWTDTIREDGEYRIEVVRLSSYCAPSFTYLLTVIVK